MVALVERLPERQRDRQLLSGRATLDPSISLLPNHYLDLASWRPVRPVRHHLTAPLEPLRDRDVPVAVDRIAELIKNIAGIAAAIGPVSRR